MGVRPPILQPEEGRWLVVGPIAAMSAVLGPYVVWVLQTLVNTVLEVFIDVDTFWPGYANYTADSWTGAFVFGTLTFYGGGLAAAPMPRHRAILVLAAAHAVAAMTTIGSVGGSPSNEAMTLFSRAAGIAIAGQVLYFVPTMSRRLTWSAPPEPERVRSADWFEDQHGAEPPLREAEAMMEVDSIPAAPQRMEADVFLFDDDTDAQPASKPTRSCRYDRT